MTKEELIESAWFDESHETSTFHVKDLNSFFESNVCIPKGETLQVKLDNSSLMDYASARKDSEYSIKPLEPIYEWQWLMVPVFSGTNALSPYMTDSEFNNSTTSRGHKYTKIEETKRDRK